MTRPTSHNYPANWPEHDAPWHCGQCAGGWDCADCRRLFAEDGDPPLIAAAPHQNLARAGEGEAVVRATPNLVGEPEQ